MSEDWAAVAAAINARVAQLGMRQWEVAERSHVSQATVRELQYNTTQRRRSARTLEAISLALGWHPRHLAAVLEGRMIPQIADPIDDGNEVATRLAAIETHLRTISGRLDDMNANLANRSPK